MTSRALRAALAGGSSWPRPPRARRRRARRLPRVRRRAPGSSTSTTTTATRSASRPGPDGSLELRVRVSGGAAREPRARSRPARPATRRCRPRPSATPTPARSSATRGRRRDAVERILAGIASTVRYDADRAAQAGPGLGLRLAARPLRRLRGARGRPAAAGRASRARTVQGVLRARARDATATTRASAASTTAGSRSTTPDRGFVFSDPSASINGVDARYIPFGSPRPRAPARPDADRASRPRAGWTTRCCKLPDATLRVRPGRRRSLVARPPPRRRSVIFAVRMAEKYAPSEIEAKWQRRWAEARVADVDTAVPGNEFYMLNMYPYPSGSRLHVGHGRNYILGDALYRRERMAGRKALNPMGWDAFGLPAENAAIQSGVPPARVHARQHRAHEGAAQRPGLPLRLVQGARLLRSGLLPLEPVALPADVGAGPRVPQDRSRSTGARAAGPCSPTSRSWTAAASGRATRSRSAT